MREKAYQIFLSEDFLDSSLFPESAFKGGYVDKPVLEIASNNASYRWQAFNIQFYTKIDGTHELTFELAREYFNEDVGAQVKNELIEYLSNKCKIEVRIEDLEYSPDKEGNTIYNTYFMVINEREDKEDKNGMTYSYSCTDSFIEELSKTGYSLSFNDDIDGGTGFGTIHQIANRIVENTDWVYRADKTGMLQEYITKAEWNENQQRYDDIEEPIPVHRIKYIPEIKQYAYETDNIDNYYTENGKTYYQPYYCAEIMESETGAAVQNMIYNGDEFTDTIGWTSFNKNGKTVITDNAIQLSSVKRNGNNYYLNMKPAGASSYLMNDTTAYTNYKLEAYQPYVFKYETTNGAKITELLISNRSLYNSNYDLSKASYRLSKPLTSGAYYVIIPVKTISTPYFSFFFELGSNTNGGDLKSISFFKLKGKTEQININLQKTIKNGQTLSGSQIENILLPENNISEDFYTSRQLKYFKRNNYYESLNTVEEKRIVLDKEDDVDTLNYYTFNNVNESRYKIVNKNGVRKIDYNTPFDVENVSELPTRDIHLNKVYYLTTENYYYQYYQVARGGSTNGDWAPALLGDGYNDKRRTLIANKSNRFNLIQELSELFKVWPVFNVYRNESGVKVKEFWFKESALRENFSGFHRGVNLSGITRKLESDEIVTKIFVEHIEKSYLTNGYVSIANSSLNPWNEEFYYNFRHYVDQGLLDGTELEQDLTTLYSSVKDLNKKLYQVQLKLSAYEENYRKNESTIYTYNIYRSAGAASIEDLKKTIEGLNGKVNTALPDVVNAENDVARFDALIKKYAQLVEKLEGENEKIQKQIDSLTTQQKTLTSQKQKLVSQFEIKYAQFIKEGTWTDSSYSDNDTYYIDSVKVSNTSALPKASWTINVIDGTVTEELKDFIFKVGDKTFLVDDFFFDDKQTKGYKFEILISGYRDYLDNPSKNQIEVRNYLSSFDDLFQRIAAATQTLELKEQTYDKSANFTANGEISASILQKTLLNNDFTLAQTDENNLIVDEKGIRLQSIPNPSKKVNISADGIYLSNKTNKETGEPLWETGITADGINAGLITAGELDVKKVKITASGQECFSWNEVGITAYHNTGDGTAYQNNFTRFDQFGLYVIKNKTGFGLKSNGEPWFYGWSRDYNINKIQASSIVSITDNGLRLNVGGANGTLTLGYINSDEYGLEISKGSGDNKQVLVNLSNDSTNNKIGGFYIDNTWFYSDTQYCGIRGKFPQQDYVFLYAGALWDRTGSIPSDMPFYVRGNGELHARTAYIGGTWIKNNNDNKYYQVYMQPLKNETGHYGETMVFSTQRCNSAGTSTITPLMFVQANGEVYCQKLYVWYNNQWTEITPGGGGGGGDWTAPCPSYPNITNPYSQTHDGVDYATNDYINNEIVAVDNGVVYKVYSNGFTQNIGSCPWGYNTRTKDKYYNLENYKESTVYKSYGKHIIFKLNNKIDGKYAWVIYAHLNQLDVSEGQSISKGGHLGLSGTTGNSTGPHLHFELRTCITDDYSQAIVTNPTPYLP